MFRLIIRLFLLIPFIIGSFSCGSIRETINNNTLEIYLSGYNQTCVGRTIVYIKNNETWREVKNPFTTMNTEACYVDGQYRQNSRCDVVRCVKLKGPLKVELVEYVKVGMKEASEDHELLPGTMVPVYKTVPLHGEIKIQLHYFIDSSCTEERIFTKIIHR
jgi:hypothetical protein